MPSHLNREALAYDEASQENAASGDLTNELPDGAVEEGTTEHPSGAVAATPTPAEQEADESAQDAVDKPPPATPTSAARGRPATRPQK